MEPIHWIVIAVLVAIVILFAFLIFNKVKVTGEGCGFKGSLEAEGKTTETQTTNSEKPNNDVGEEVKHASMPKIEASGTGAIAMGGPANNATITTNVNQGKDSSSS